MTSNSQPIPGCAHRKGSRDAQMVAFDRLPKSVRAALANAPALICAEDCLAAKHAGMTAGEIVDAIERLSGEARAAMRAEMLALAARGRK